MLASRSTRKRTASKPRTPGARRNAAKLKEARRHAENQIDEFLRSVGVRNPSEWTDQDGARHMVLGGTEGYAQADIADGVVTLTVAAVVMPVSADQELIVPLMRELLETNTVIWGAPRLAIAGDSVWLGATHRVETLSDDDYASEIHRVMSLAQEASKDLRKRYGGTTRKRKRARIDAVKGVSYKGSGHSDAGTPFIT